jgi:tripartite-type tricarboxylate transporter receptor subunit TctC
MWKVASRRFLAVVGVAMLVATACGGAATPSPSPSAAGSGSGTTVQQPTRPVEFVISTAVGGGSDIYARAMQAIIEEQKLSPQPVQPTNKEGGSGAVAFTYVFEKKGDMHYIMITLNSFFTTIVTQPALPFKATDFTPIANLALDPFFLWVNEDSKWQNAGDFVKDAKERQVVAAGTGSKQEDEVMFLRIAEVTGIKTPRYVPQSGGGLVATALAGHQAGVEVTVNNPSEGLGLYAQKKLRPLCSFTPTSPTTGVYAGLATCKSQGIPIDDYYIMRAIMAPPGLSAPQQAFWVDVFRKVFESAKWKDFMNTNALTPDFRSGIDFRAFISNYEKLHKDIATKNKWV